jgi:anti-sigma factor RsiW
MSGEPRGITEDDLHGFVDNQLPPDRRGEVQRHLDTNPEAAVRVAAYVAQRAALRAALAGATGGPVPAWLDPRLLLRQRQWRRRMAWRAAAAVVLALGLGGGGGWLLRGAFAPSQHDIAALVREAVANHVVYAADRRRPTELGADQRDDLARWVSNRINHKVAPPDLSDSGFRYIGGRLAATPEGPAGMFMYQNEAGIRLTVFVRPDSKARNAPLSPVAAASVGGAAWIERGVGYSVIAPVPADELRRIAEQVRRLLSGPA